MAKKDEDKLRRVTVLYNDDPFYLIFMAVGVLSALGSSFLGIRCIRAGLRKPPC